MHDFTRLLFSSRQWFTLLLISLLVSSCAFQSERIHPQFSNHCQSMDRMLVLQPEVRIYKEMPDGSRLYQESMSLEAQHNAQASIIREFENQAFTVQTTEAFRPPNEDMNDVAMLFRSVNRSIQLHTFGPQIYPAKLETFEYSVGSVDNLLSAAGADGLVMAIGYQTGTEKPDKNWFALALIEPQGNVIWYNLTCMPDRFNFQRQNDISALVAETMHNFRKP